MTVTTELAANGTAPMARLDPYAGGLSAEAPRVDALAVISCGYRAEKGEGNRPGLPRASRPGDAVQVHLHDPLHRAPGLEQAIADGKQRQLTIAFPLDDPRQFVIQRFTRYSATRLEAYGDEASITWIHPAADGKDARHQRFEVGSGEYDRLVRTCKADTRIYFCLADWTSTGPEVIFPDGLGVYAIRTTSRHSVRSILGSLAYTARFTRGKIAGLPFLLSVDHREVAGPDGAKRTVPVWTITTKPPEGARLSSRTFRDIATAALREGSSLMLPPPDAETWEQMEHDGPPPVDEPTEQEIGQLERGGLCDYDFWVRSWHALARGTAWDSDAARASFIGGYTDGATTSLSQFLHGASEDQAAGLVAALGEGVANARRQPTPSRYEEIFGTEKDAYHLGAMASPAPPAEQPARESEPPADSRGPAAVGMVTSRKSPLWTAFSAARAQAEAEGIEVPPLDPPQTEESLRTSTAELVEAVEQKRGLEASA